MKNAIKYILVAGIAILATVAFVSHQPKPASFGDIQGNTFYSVTSSTVSVASASSTTVLSANSGRIYAAIVNNCNYDAYLALGATATKGQGIRLNRQGGAYEINSLNDYTGVISAIASISDGTDTCAFSLTEK